MFKAQKAEPSRPEDFDNADESVRASSRKHRDEYKAMSNSRHHSSQKHSRMETPLSPAEQLEAANRAQQEADDYRIRTYGTQNSSHHAAMNTQDMESSKKRNPRVRVYKPEQDVH